MPSWVTSKSVSYTHLNLFYTPGDPIWQWKFLKITVEGIWAAIYMVLRISMLITCTFLLTYTTSPILLTDGLEKLLGPLKKLRVPVHELSMMMSIALRFIPTLIEETDKIMSAQKARGADFDTGNLFQKADVYKRQSMVIDHVGMLFAPMAAVAGADDLLYHLFRYAGRLAFPIFAFFVAEGCLHTHDFRRYLLRLCLLYTSRCV